MFACVQKFLKMSHTISACIQLIVYWLICREIYDINMGWNDKMSVVTWPEICDLIQVFMWFAIRTDFLYTTSRFKITHVALHMLS